MEIQNDKSKHAELTEKLERAEANLLYAIECRAPINIEEEMTKIYELRKMAAIKEEWLKASDYSFRQKINDRLWKPSNKYDIPTDKFKIDEKEWKVVNDLNAAHYIQTINRIATIFCQKLSENIYYMLNDGKTSEREINRYRRNYALEYYELYKDIERPLNVLKDCALIAYMEENNIVEIPEPIKKELEKKYDYKRVMRKIWNHAVGSHSQLPIND